MNSILANWPIALEGIYHNSSMVNGKASWSSTSNAVWYTQGFWNIGYLADIGSSFAEIYSDYGSKCPFDIPSEKWYYGYNGVWTSAEANEIKLDCLKGNFPK